MQGLKIRPRFNPLSRKALALRPCQSIVSRRIRLGVHAFNGETTFQELKTIANAAKLRAEELLPDLQQATATANVAREPAVEAEKRWQQAHEIALSVHHESHTALEELRTGTTMVLGGSEELSEKILQHHTHHRLETFLNNLTTPDSSQLFPPTKQHLSWLPGSTMLTQLAACYSIDDGNKTPYVVACITVTATPLEVDALRSVMLHWGVSDGPHGGWMNFIPQGWHTSPSVSQPCGKTAWETGFASYSPVLTGNHVVSTVEAFSVVVQIPFEEKLGAMKYVLKRTDGGQPEWIKPWHNADFILDFQPVKDWFEYRRQQEQLIGMKAAAAAGTAALLSSSSVLNTNTNTVLVDTDTDWGWGDIVQQQPPREDGSDYVLYSFDWDDTVVPSSVQIGFASDSDSGSDDVVLMNNNNNTNDEYVGGEQQQQQQEPTAISLMEWTPPVIEPLPGGWLASVERWEVLSDHSPSVRGLGQQLQHLKSVLNAALNGETTEEQATRINELLQRCEAVEDTLHKYDSAALTARAAQHEKEKLWEAHKEASQQATHLQSEIEAAVTTARRATVALKGRATEVTVGDLRGLCYHLAAEGQVKAKGSGFWPFGGAEQGNNDRKMVFISEKEMRISGLAATLVSHVYLEGPSAAVDALLSPKPISETDDMDDGDAQNTKKKESEPQPTLDTILIALSLGEEFPDGNLSSEVLVHFGCVPHSGAKWKVPPTGWSSSPTTSTKESNSTKNDAMPSCTFQEYTLTRDGSASPVLIDPELYGLCIKLPLKECVLRRIKGVEFVLKTKEDEWLSWDKGHGVVGNFYVELPVPGK